jgi:hypothetical protein
MLKFRFLFILVVVFAIAGMAIAGPFGLKDSIPQDAVNVLQKYIEPFGKGRIEQVDRLSDTTFLFVVKIKNEAIGGDDTVRFIIVTKYLTYKVIYDTTALR